jgi:hypothetical protein
MDEWRSRGNPKRHERNNGTATEERYFLCGSCRNVISRISWLGVSQWNGVSQWSGIGQLVVGW